MTKMSVKTLDNYTDKVYEHCVSEARRAARTSLKEERLKLGREEDQQQQRLNPASGQLFFQKCLSLVSNLPLTALDTPT